MLEIKRSILVIKQTMGLVKTREPDKMSLSTRLVNKYVSEYKTQKKIPVWNQEDLL